MASPLDCPPPGPDLAHSVARIADAFVGIEAALQRLASPFPFFDNDRARWAWHVANTAIEQRPAKPEKLTDARARAAVLAQGLAESLVYWTMTEAQRAEHDAARNAEKKASDGSPTDRSGGY